MDFEFSEGQVLLRDSLRQLLAREHTVERQQAILESTHGHSEQLWRLLAELGVFRLGLSDDAGGCGGPIEIMLVMEELGRALVLEPFMSTVVLGGGLVRGFGTVAQRARLLPKIATGNLRLALAHQEARARYVLDPVATLARRGKGSYSLSGTKAGVLDAPLADLVIVSARDDAAGGLSLFMLEPGVAGVSWTTYRSQDGRSVADLVLDDVKLPTAARLGPPGVALTALEQAVDCALAALCAEAVGVMEAVTDAVRQPELFLMATQAKALSYLATGRCRERDRLERHRALSAAKAFVGRAARAIGQTTIKSDVHGKAAELMINQYRKRLNVINATFGEIDHHIGALSDLLRAEQD